jgi:hypothetical protein
MCRAGLWLLSMPETLRSTGGHRELSLPEPVVRRHRMHTLLPRPLLQVHHHILLLTQRATFSTLTVLASLSAEQQQDIGAGHQAFIARATETGEMLSRRL